MYFSRACILAIGTALAPMAGDAVPLPHRPSGSLQILAEKGVVLAGNAWLTDTRMGTRNFHMNGASAVAFDLAPLRLKAGTYNIGFIARTGTRQSDPIAQIPRYRLSIETSPGHRRSLGTLRAPIQSIFHPVMESGEEDSWANWFGSIQCVSPSILTGSERLIVENLSDHGGILAIWVQPVQPLNSVEIDLTPNAPGHAFIQGMPPLVTLSLRLPDSLPPMDTTIYIAWIDLLTEKVNTSLIRAHLRPGKTQTFNLKQPLLPGVYRVMASLSGTGSVATVDNISGARCTVAYTPARMARDLPDDWPMGTHVSGSIPPLPGFRWYRYFAEWADINPAPGQYDWREFDRIVREVRQAGGRLMIASDGSPLWTTTRGKAGMPWLPAATAYPPDNWDSLRDYLRTMLKRYENTRTLGALELCNEANTQERWQGDPRQMLEMARVFRNAAHSVRPPVQIIGIAASAGDQRTYVRELVDAGILTLVDAVSAHFYEELMSYEQDAPGSSLPGHVAMLSGPMRAAGVNLPMINTESGIAFVPREENRLVSQDELNNRAEHDPGFHAGQPWLVGSHWRKVSERRAAATYVSGAVMLMAQGVRQSFFYSPESFVIDQAPSLPWVALGQLGSFLYDVDYHNIRPIEAGYTQESGQDDQREAVAYLLGQPGKRQLMVAWGYIKDAKIGRSKLWQPWLEPAPLAINADIGEGEAVSLYGRDPTPVRSKDGKIVVKCGEEPVFIRIPASQ